MHTEHDQSDIQNTMVEWPTDGERHNNGTHKTKRCLDQRSSDQRHGQSKEPENEAEFWLSYVHGEGNRSTSEHMAYIRWSKHNIYHHVAVPQADGIQFWS